MLKDERKFGSFNFSYYLCIVIKKRNRYEKRYYKILGLGHHSRPNILYFVCGVFNHTSDNNILFSDNNWIVPFLLFRDRE